MGKTNKKLTKKKENCLFLSQAQQTMNQRWALLNRKRDRKVIALKYFYHKRQSENTSVNFEYRIKKDI